MRKFIKRSESGFTLIELMVGILVGLILLSTVTGIFVTMIKSDSDNLKSIRLNQQLRAKMSLITRDLRRSGFNGDAAAQVLAGTANPFEQMDINVKGTTSPVHCLVQDPDATHPPLGCPCLIYSYDENNNGVDDGGSEHFGFRLNGGTIESRQNSELCSSNNTWNPVTDNSLVEITDFSVSDPDLPGDLVPDPATGVPGEETDRPGKTIAGITIHRITISMTGRLVRDNHVVRTITETVEIRNADY